MAALAIVLPFWVLAADDNIYSIDAVEVDVTAETAAAARTQALAEGHVMAFRRLMARIVSRKERDKVSKLDVAQIEPLLQSFEIESEKTSPVRYLATLSFLFKREAVRALLQEADLAFAETRSKPVLILPVFERSGANLLWDDPNPWREAWSAMPPADGLVPMVVPVGDLTDINDISADQAIAGARERLQAIAERYGAANVIMALAVLGQERKSGRPSLQVTVVRFGAEGEDRTVVRGFVSAPQQDAEQLIALAAAEIAADIEEEWKSENLLRLGEEGDLVALFPVRQLADWVALEQDLGNVPLVRESQIVEMTRQQVKVRLRYLGSTQQLKLALAQKDLVLTDLGEGWYLQRAGAGEQVLPEAETGPR